METKEIQEERVRQLNEKEIVEGDYILPVLDAGSAKGRVQPRFRVRCAEGKRAGSAAPRDFRAYGWLPGGEPQALRLLARRFTGRKRSAQRAQDQIRSAPWLPG